MPLPLAPVVAALLGVAFALVGRDEVRRSSGAASATRGFLVVALVALGLLAPALGYFLWFYPDWAFCYLVPGSRVPSALSLVAVLLVASLGPLSFTWAASALRRHGVRELVRGVSALIVLLVITIAFLGPRLVVAGTHTAFKEGYDLSPVGGTSLGLSILWIDGCLLAGIAWAASRVRALGRN